MGSSRMRIRHYLPALLATLFVACQPLGTVEQMVDQALSNLQPPSPQEICGQSSANSTEEQRIAAISEAVAQRGNLALLSTDDWDNIIQEAGYLAGIRTYHPQITIVQNGEDMLGIFWWCEGAIQGEVYVVEDSFDVTYMCLLIDTSFSSEWSWHAEQVGNGWGLMNIYNSPRGGSYGYYPLVISHSTFGWILLVGDKLGLAGNGPNFYFQSPAIYSFAEDFTLTFHVNDPAQPYDKTYVLDTDHYELAGQTEP